MKSYTTEEIKSDKYYTQTGNWIDVDLLIEEFNTYSQDNYDLDEIISMLKEMKEKGD